MIEIDDPPELYDSDCRCYSGDDPNFYYGLQLIDCPTCDDVHHVECGCKPWWSIFETRDAGDGATEYRWTVKQASGQVHVGPWLPFTD